MVDRKPGEPRDKERDSHHPVDILTRDAIPASFGVEQAAELMETDKTKWVVCLATGSCLVLSECDVKSACFAVGGIVAIVLGKVSSVFAEISSSFPSVKQPLVFPCRSCARR